MEEEQLVVTEPSRRTPDGTGADLESEERRGWLSHGIAALAVSALGLAVAGSVVITTNAQTTAVVDPPQTSVNRTVTDQTSSTGQRGPQQGQLPGTLPGVGTVPATKVTTVPAFTRRAAEMDDPSRSSLRSAIVEERAAQRSEDLTESAEQTAAAALEAGSKARAAKLAKSDRERRIAAVKLAQERTKKAIQVRVAAEVQRELAAKKAAEAEAKANSNTNSNTTPDPAENTTTPEPPDTSDIPSGGGAASPVPGAIVGASFGATGAWARYHTGLDFRAGFGTPIRAVTSGVVTYAGNKGNWAGNHVAVKHAGGYSTMSSHMQSISVRVGESVSAGQVIGYVGSTGRSFGAHLHFEVYPPGVNPGDVYQAINPITWLRARGVDTN